jgi:hypothetical protein
MNGSTRFSFVRSTAVLAGLMLASSTASALSFQGVTFTTTYVSTSSFTLLIEDALTGGTGNWANVDQLQALSIKGFGDFTTATVVPAGTFSPNELNANFCSGGDSGGACFTFTPPLAVSDSMLFTFTFTGSNILESMTPHVKIAFLCPGDNNACGDLLSQGVPFGDDDDGDGDDDDDTDLPEPGSLALLGLGLLGLGLSRRRKA